MSTLTLGAQPVELDVILNADADFAPSIARDDDSNFSVGAVLKLVFTFRGSDPVEWISSINGSTATWNIDKVQVNAVIAAHPSSVKLWLIEGSTETLWATGIVTANR